MSDLDARLEALAHSEECRRAAEAVLQRLALDPNVPEEFNFAMALGRAEVAGKVLRERRGIDVSILPCRFDLVS